MQDQGRQQPQGRLAGLDGLDQHALGGLVGVGVDRADGEGARLGRQQAQDVGEAVGAVDDDDASALAHCLQQEARPGGQAVVGHPGAELAFGRGAQGAGVVEEGRIADRPVERRQAQGAKTPRHIALHDGGARLGVVQFGILTREGGGGCIALQSGQQDAGASGGDLHQDGARAAACLDQSFAGARLDGGGQQGGVHARAITLRRLAQADAAAQKGGFGHICGGSKG